VYTAGKDMLEDAEWDFESFKRDKLAWWVGADESEWTVFHSSCLFGHSIIYHHPRRNANLIVSQQSTSNRRDKKNETPSFSYRTPTQSYVRAGHAMTHTG
jgi:hypothetical protein